MAKFEGYWAVLCFQQMATKTQIRAEDYLRMTFEHDAEFVHGEIVERCMPDEVHSAIQFLILLRFGTLIHSYPLYPRPEIPPLVVVEILSKDDRHSDLMQKLEEYRTWGVPHIWVIDPSTKRFSMYTKLGLQHVSSLSLSDYSFQLTPAELFANL